MKYDELVQQIHELDVSLTKRAASAVNVSLNIRNWMIGAWIVNYEQNGSDRAEYGEKVIQKLAKSIQVSGLSIANLKRCRQFFVGYQGIGATLSRQFENLIGNQKGATVSHLFKSLEFLESSEIVQTVAAQSVPEIDPEIFITRLSFSQIVELLKIEDSLQRRFYEIEAIKGNWSVRELKRQIGSLLFERTGLSTDKEKLIRLTNEKASELCPGEIIRDPYVFEFIGLRPQEVVEESQLEHLLLDDLQGFLLELGRGFCLEDRQKRIQIGSEYYFVDLVFYHRLLKCHILIDLKTRAFEHGDAGQLNTYVNYYRENEMAEDDQPPIGLLLCTAKDEALAKYALGGMDENLFVSRYQTALPNAEELQRFLVEETLRLGIGEPTED